MSKLILLTIALMSVIQMNKAALGVSEVEVSGSKYYLIHDGAQACLLPVNWFNFFTVMDADNFVEAKILKTAAFAGLPGFTANDSSKKVTLTAAPNTYFTDNLNTKPLKSNYMDICDINIQITDKVE